MGSRIKSLFLGNNGRNSTSKKSNPRLRGQSYDTTVALDPPLKGSYPVAGNGPNVLDEIQRSRAKRDSNNGNITAAVPPDISRRREDVPARPQTAPGDGSAADSGYTRGRTFSMRSRRTSIFSPSPRRRNSSQSASAEPPPLPKPAREIQTYQPTTGTIIPEGFTPPYVDHNRTSSHASRKSHVDLLDAQSTIVKSSREQSRHRTKASGHRDYGEDVADRNISRHGERNERESRLDLNAPEFSYLKSVYSPKKGGVAGVEGSPSRAASALGHVLGSDTTNDDTTIRTSAQRGSQSHTKTASVRSTGSQSRPAVALPHRDSASARSFGNSRTHDDAPPTVNGSGTYDRRGRRLSPLSTTPSSINDERPTREPRRHSIGNSTRAVSSPARGRTQFGLKEPPPVPPPATATTPRAASVSKPSPNTSTVRKPVARRPRTMSAASQSTATVTSTTNGTGSKNGSVDYSSFPSASKGRTQPNIAPKKDYIVKGASEPPSLKGVVDLTNTVDTDITTKTLPAVTHEHVTPTRHEIVQEVITREIHTHDVYHRVLPVIETEILPTKHYIKSPDGKSLIEIPESEVPHRSISGKPNGDWQITKRPNGAVDLPTALRRPHHRAASAAHPPVDDAADAPVIGLARGEPRRDNRSRGNSLKSLSSKGKSILEPILTSKKEYMTKDGIPRTEYVWRHPPVFETVDGKTQPVYIGAGLGDISGTAHGDEDDIAGREFSAASGKNGVSEEALLFRDSGYGVEGMLPGLQDRSPMADLGRGTVVLDGTDGGLGKSVGNVKVDGNLEEKALRRKPVQVEGEATKALRRMRERRRSSAASRSSGSIGELQNGVKNLSVRQ